MTDNTRIADKPRGIKNIFVGSKGLRAGWGISIFVLVTGLMGVGLAVSLHALGLHSPKASDLTALQTAFFEGLAVILVLLATLITAGLERRSLVKLGFGLKNAVPRLLQGLVVGAAALAALVGILYLCGAIRIGTITLHGADIWRYGAEWGLAYLVVGTAEELLFRGYLQQTLARGLNFRWAALIMCVLFTLAHMSNAGESPVGLLLVFAAGAVLSYSIWRTGSLWWGIGFHSAWDWMQSFTFGVADSGFPARDALMTSRPAGPDWLSGGSTGPEGSVLTLGVMIVVALVIHFTLRKPDEDMGVKG